MFTSGTVLHSLWRTLVAGLSFGAPVIFTAYPAWENLTIGAIVFALLHFAETQITK